MPLVNIYTQKGKSEKMLNTIGDVIHQSLVDTWDIPEDDRSHTFHEIDKKHFQIKKNMWGMNRSDDLVFLHILTSLRTTTEMKLNFYKKLPKQLSTKLQISPDDVFICLTSNHKEDWSLGKGIAQLINN